MKNCLVWYFFMVLRVPGFGYTPVPPLVHKAIGLSFASFFKTKNTKCLPNENDPGLQICFGPPKFQLNQTIFCLRAHPDFENHFPWEWHINHTMNFLNCSTGCRSTQHFQPDCMTCCRGKAKY